MSRKPAQSIDQVEKDPTFIFREQDANKTQDKSADKRAAPKEFVVEREETGLYFIKYTAGGEVPDTLKGKWTSLFRAEEAITNYLVTKAQEEAAKAAAAVAA